MTASSDQSHTHPFLRGNFAPVFQEYISHSCQIVHGHIPEELIGGQYIRNGGNPIYPPEKGRHYHWFDGDGMLHGVFFDSHGQPLYTNRHLSTPLLTMTLLLLRSPLPSIALLISPLSSIHRIIVAIVQAFLIALRARMGVLSVANTSVIWDQRLLATCESGPPLEVRLPSLRTVGWDRLKDPHTGESLADRRGQWEWWKRFGLSRVQEDWMTAHPRIDPVDGTLLLYSTQMFDAPHVRYSVIDKTGRHVIWKAGIDVGRAKMMHDFAATRTHTILLNLPLTLAPHNLFSRPPVPLIHFDRSLPSEFVIFPRMRPQQPVRFRDPEPSLMFHTANAWDECDVHGTLQAVNMLGCRFRSAKLVYAAGAVEIPRVEKAYGTDDVCRLQYYRFDMTGSRQITHEFPLSAIPFEFPTLPPHVGMSAARHIYGCTMRSGSFDERLGGAAKVDCIAKLDVIDLIRRGCARGEGKTTDPVDARSSAQILQDWEQGRPGAIELFALPPGWYAQEPRFVPRSRAKTEDDGYLLTYVYDESYLLPDGTPSTAPNAGSELWVIDARRLSEGMSAIVSRIKLPQRVPYGLHGTFVSASAIRQQKKSWEPLPRQDLLQDKLAHSRLQYFVSILFDRPMHRHRSKTEKVVLGIMWPIGVVMLALALREIARYVVSN
ncbi:hypothetical protein I302_105076 [Kwoniella bestiolae CBS 10118]|uniref:Carotenoid oxygenase n=1 Tax=Kwoniella bestiolae CBS 10118 TaxID=1296100 RepID=A0A1B9FS47_9TREE|nr:hypothetical protein I302_08365 [Kwoniella bestiolae CBS 10118]OCF21591.1 hypothetical protein I302_08365 [Kwoniella bestiolae CBS 10118]